MSKLKPRAVTRVNNTSDQRGVVWDKNRVKWLVRIKGKHVGRFSKYSDAVEARLKAETEVCGVVIG